MATETVEERLTSLEQKVERLLSEGTPELIPAPWWEQWFGAFKDNPNFDAAMKHGENYRRSQPTVADASDTDGA